jgi:hypothetical protein
MDGLSSCHSPMVAWLPGASLPESCRQCQGVREPSHNGIRIRLTTTHDRTAGQLASMSTAARREPNGQVFADRKRSSPLNWDLSQRSVALNFQSKIILTRRLHESSAALRTDARNATLRALNQPGPGRPRRRWIEKLDAKPARLMPCFFSDFKARLGRKWTCRVLRMNG